MKNILVVILALMPSIARAQQIDDPTHIRLVRDAFAARDSGNHPRALALALQASETRVYPVLRLFIAQEEFRLNDFVATVTQAQACAQDPAGNESLRQQCLALVRDCEGLVSRLSVRVPSAEQPGTIVRVNGRVFARDEWERPHYMLPGETLVEANATGRQPFRQHVTLVRGHEHVVEILFALTADSPRTGPWILMGIGASGLAAAGAFTAAYYVTTGHLNDDCHSDSACQLADQGSVTIARDTQGQANDFGVAAYVSIGIGSAVTTAGVAWFLANRHTQAASPRSAAVVFVPAPHGGLISLGGTF